MEVNIYIVDVKQLDRESPNSSTDQERGSAFHWPCHVLISLSNSLQLVNLRCV